ncbi:hypothetical protein BK702_18275 [Bacillus thuringiensis serovar cameroun]|nr:hypothetical protein BK702_18275 [Bacillus thuringiensis serovar cameroun]
MNIQNKRTLERLLNYRENNGVTFQFISKQISIHYNNISKWKADKTQFSLETLRRINDWLDSKER